MLAAFLFVHFQTLYLGRRIRSHIKVDIVFFAFPFVVYSRQSVFLKSFFGYLIVRPSHILSVFGYGQRSHFLAVSPYLYFFETLQFITCEIHFWGFPFQGGVQRTGRIRNRRYNLRSGRSVFSIENKRYVQPVQYGIALCIGYNAQILIRNRVGIQIKSNQMVVFGLIIIF